jgi:hypothetical protein
VGLRRILITLTWNCYRDLLNLCLQHLIEAQLVLRSYCEVVHLGIDVPPRACQWHESFCQLHHLSLPDCNTLIFTWKQNSRIFLK